MGHHESESILHNLIRISAEMAPYLLLGFAVAGFLHVVISQRWIERHLGSSGFWQVLKASLIGVPLPLCSCGIIPVAASLRQVGGSRGAVASFTAATPQTGVDSILATGGMLGWPFAGVRVLTSVISGTVAGLFVDRFGTKDEVSGEALETGSCCCCGAGNPEEENRLSAVEEEEGTPCCHSSGGQITPASPSAKLVEAMRYGFLKLPSDLSISLLIGLVVAAVITTFLPPSTISESLPDVYLQYLIAMAVGTPFYVCSTGSIPVALGFVVSGVSPGAALIFLMVGPATNAATLVALPRIIGLRSTVAYLAGLCGVALIAAVILDGVGFQFMGAVAGMEMGEAVWKRGAALLLFGLLLYPLGRRLLQRARLAV
ncbi:MAG: SO_0444 family Cu/Zn efflux transporter [Puniceicoccaceae bacterium]